MAKINLQSPQSLVNAAETITSLITSAEFPPALEQAINDASEFMGSTTHSTSTFAVRSSALLEDSETSFAGQYSSFLHVKLEQLVEKYKQVLASKYSAEAISYRIKKGYGDEETAMSVLIQEMVSASFSGIIYTSGIYKQKTANNEMTLYITQGFGDSLADGGVSPTCVTLSKSENPQILATSGPSSSFPEEKIIQLATWGLQIESHYSSTQDIEWAMDVEGNSFILQTRPLFIESEQPLPSQTVMVPDDKIVIGRSEIASRGAAAGRVYRLDNEKDIETIPPGAILVCRETPPAYVSFIDQLSAVIAERGSQACHFATIAREFSVPYLCNLGAEIQKLSTGDQVTVDGSTGNIYDGEVAEIISTSKQQAKSKTAFHTRVEEALSFITPLELTHPEASNFIPEGCRSMHDIIRFCHEKSMQLMFTSSKPGSGRGSLRLAGSQSLEVYLFDVGGGIAPPQETTKKIQLEEITSRPFHALWQGLNHEDVQWKQKPFDWEAYEKIEMSGAFAPKQDSFAFASYAVVGQDYLHFNMRFGYHFTIVDTLCGEDNSKNHCMLRFAGGGADFDQRSLRITFLTQILSDLDFSPERKGDLLEARITHISQLELEKKLDILGRLLGASKLMDMVLDSDHMVEQCVNDFHKGVYSFSERG